LHKNYRVRGIIRVLPAFLRGVLAPRVGLHSSRVIKLARRTTLAALIFLGLVLAPSFFPGKAHLSDESTLPVARQNEFHLASQPGAFLQYSDMPYFTYPVVPNAVVSMWFDHHPTGGLLTLYDGRRNNAGFGFTFTCSNPRMSDYVGCEDNVTGEAACPNQRELWYDGHRGTDYEFSPNWHTGAFCDPGRFSGITMPINAPARGRVIIAGTDPSRPANGWHIRLAHDLNNNGNFNDDNFRSIYLHFTANALAVTANQVVESGQYLGLGGSTGYSSSPHLHFEVQRSTTNFQSNYWAVDPYGWQGSGSDPWTYQNVNLWRYPVVDYPFKNYIPLVSHAPSACQGCGEMLTNGGFESGHNAWVEQGVQVIASTADGNLPVTPYSGRWLAWLAGLNSAADILYQNFSLPAWANDGILRYALRVTSLEPAGAQDAMTISLRTSDGTLLQTLDTIDNTFSPKNQWVIREIDLGDLSPRQGQTLQLRLHATSNASYLTSFYVDEVSLLVNGP